MNSFPYIHALLLANSIPHDIATKAGLMISGVADEDNLSQDWQNRAIQAFLADYVRLEGDYEVALGLLEKWLKGEGDE